MIESWHSKVVHDPTFNAVSDACTFFDREYLAAVREVDIEQLRGRRIDEVQKWLPGIIGFRFYQLEELNAIMDFLEIRLTAIKGMRWESPRGPVEVDSNTRDLVQNVYIRRTELRGGKYVNTEIDTIPAVSDPNEK